MVHYGLRPNAPYSLIDDLGRVDAETALLRRALTQCEADLLSGAFVRAGPGSIRIATRERL